MKEFSKRVVGRYKNWFTKPIDKTDRLSTALISAWAGLWIGALGYMIFGVSPMPVGLIAKSALLVSVVCVVLSLFFPRAMRIIAFPFIFLSVGGS